MTADQLGELVGKMNGREKNLHDAVVMDVGIYLHTKRVPPKYRVREVPDKDPVDLRLIAQAFHLQAIDIASSLVTNDDGKGRIVEFHPKPYGVKGYKAKPGETESPGITFSFSADEIAKLRKDYGLDDAFDDLFGGKKKP